MYTTKKKYFIFLNLVVWMFFGIVLFLGAIPKTPLMIDENIKKQISIILPNRWPFFTKDPREEYIYILQKDSEGYVFQKNLPNSSYSNAYGLINYQRAVGIEFGIISSQIDDDLWNINDSGKNLFKILEKDSIKTLKIKKTIEITELKGEYVFVKIEPLPYLWRNKINQFEMPSKFVKIIIE